MRSSPLAWVTATLLAYAAASTVHRRVGMNPLANPVLLSVTFIVGALLLTRTPYETYFEGARLVHFLVGPATVALAIPLHAHLDRLKILLVPLTIALLVGSITGIGSAVAIGWALGAPTTELLAPPGR